MAERIDWTLWRSFLAVAEAGSLSGAARSLGLTQPTVGRHLDALESAVGQSLFLRAPQGLIASEAALALVPEARAMQLAADSLARRATAPTEPGMGTVRIAASHVVGAEVLPAALAPLLAEHPRLSVELALSNESADLLRHEADLAVRMVRPAQGSLIARRLAAVPLGLFAHRDYLGRAGRPETLDDLSAHVLIGPDRDPIGLAGIAALGGSLSRANLRIRTDSEAAQIAAVRAGVGIGVVQAGIAARDPFLEQVLGDYVRFELEAWLVLHDDLRGLTRIRLVADHLAATLPLLFARQSCTFRDKDG